MSPGAFRAFLEIYLFFQPGCALKIRASLWVLSRIQRMYLVQMVIIDKINYWL